MSHNPAPKSDKDRAIGRAITARTLPYAMATHVKPYLKRTPEYERARAERRATAWLERESMSLGRALAAVIEARLDDLDAPQDGEQ